MPALHDIEYVLERQPDGAYLIYVPELPGLATEGSTREEAIAMLRDALPAYLQSKRDLEQSRATTRVADAERLREQAQRLADAASSARARKAPTVAALGLDDVVLPPSVLEAAAEVLREQAQGRESEIVVLRETLSAQQAADLLCVSRPHLTMLLDRDRIPYQTTAGGHRRIRRSDIQDYRERQQLAHAAMRESMRSGEALADDE